MKRVQRFICDECEREHPAPELAECCEVRDRKYKEERAAVIAEESKWLELGHDVWRENGKLCHAETVSQDNYGPHNYGSHEGTSDCANGCGCWMGAYMSGGPVDPGGRCPNNKVGKGESI